VWLEEQNGCYSTEADEPDKAFITPITKHQVTDDRLTVSIYAKCSNSNEGLIGESDVQGVSLDALRLLSREDVTKLPLSTSTTFRHPNIGIVPNPRLRAERHRGNGPYYPRAGVYYQ
jgi:hypothetical protein